MDSEAKKAVWIVEDLLERMDRPPARNCTCHISPPCNDCVEYSDIREAIENAEEFIQEMSRLGTSAVEASKAFQDLQEASKDLVDQEIAVPAVPVRPVLRGGQILNENQRPKRPGPLWLVEGATSADSHCPAWYKRLWNFLASPFCAASEFEDLVNEYQAAGIWGGGTIPPGYSIQDARNIPIPYDRRQGTDIGLPEYKMLVKNSDIDQAFRYLLRKPWYKRLWSCLRGTK